MKPAKGIIGQLLPLDPQQLGAGEIYLPDHPVGIKGEIADRRIVIEFGILVPGQLKLLLGSAQFRILHLQLDLVDLKFMGQPYRFSLCRWMERIRSFRA
jgi:hypothetical protein